MCPLPFQRGFSDGRTRVAFVEQHVIMWETTLMQLTDYKKAKLCRASFVSHPLHELRDRLPAQQRSAPSAFIRIERFKNFAVFVSVVAESPICATVLFRAEGQRAEPCSRRGVDFCNGPCGPELAPPYKAPWARPARQIHVDIYDMVATAKVGAKGSEDASQLVRLRSPASPLERHRPLTSGGSIRLE